MKRIPYVPPIGLQNIDGEPLKDTRTGLSAMDQLEFFRGRISDPSFLEGKESGDGLILQWETRERAYNQRGTAAAVGYWEFEDEQYKQLLNSTNKGTAYNPQLSFNLVPFIFAVRRAETPRENAAEQPRGQAS